MTRHRSLRTFWAFAAALSTAWILPAGCDQLAGGGVAKQIQTTFEQMKAACDTGDGQSALTVYTQGTFDHYASVVRLALDGDIKAILAEPPTTVVEVLGIRSKATRAQIQPLDGKGYVAFAVSAGWWAGSLDGLSIRDVKVSGDFATATAFSPELEKEHKRQAFQRSLFGGNRRRGVRGGVDKPPTYAVRFVKEADGWKYDELSMLPHLDREINADCNAARISLRDYLMKICSDDDEKLPMSIWQPMPRKK